MPHIIVVKAEEYSQIEFYALDFIEERVGARLSYTDVASQQAVLFAGGLLILFGPFFGLECLRAHTIDVNELHLPGCLLGVRDILDVEL